MVVPYRFIIPLLRRREHCLLSWPQLTMRFLNCSWQHAPYSANSIPFTRALTCPSLCDLRCRSGKIVTFTVPIKRFLDTWASIQLPRIRINSPTLAAHRTVMQHSFGTKISGNKRVGGELPEAQRSGIINPSKAGFSKAEIARDLGVNRSTTHNRINQFKNYHRLKSLPSLAT